MSHLYAEYIMKKLHRVSGFIILKVSLCGYRRVCRSRLQKLFDPVLCLAGDLIGLFHVGRFSLRPEAAVCLTFIFSFFPPGSFGPSTLFCFLWSFLKQFSMDCETCHTVFCCSKTEHVPVDFDTVLLTHCFCLTFELLYLTVFFCYGLLSHCLLCRLTANSVTPYPQYCSNISLPAGCFYLLQ